MPRSVPEWVGKTPDTPVPRRVRLRVFDRKKGRCHNCRRPIRGGQPWTCEHLIAIVNDGENRENNLDVTCSICLPIKNAADVAEKSIVRRKRGKHILKRKAKGRAMPGTRAAEFENA